MPQAIGPIMGSVVGGLMGGDSQQGQSATKEPWEPARKPLINSLNTGQDLERYYQQNPFNPMQRTGYQNMFTDLDMFRNQMAPGLMQFANQMMGSNYQRGPRNSQMEAMQGMGGGMQSTRPQMMQQGPDGSFAPQGGLAGAMGQAGGQMRPITPGASSWADAMGGKSSMSYGGQGAQGLLSGQSGPFGVAPGQSYGLLDWKELNPFTSTSNGIPKPPEKPAGETDDERRAREERERYQRYLDDEIRGAGA